MVLDAKAANHFLTQKHIGTLNIIIVAASVETNIGLKYAASDPSVEAVVLLSYHIPYVDSNYLCVDVAKRREGVTSHQDSLQTDDDENLLPDHVDFRSLGCHFQRHVDFH